MFTTDTVIYLLGLAATAGTIIARISALEKKVDKHNNVIERVYSLEADVGTIKRDIKEIREELSK